LIEKLGEKETMKVMMEQLNWDELDFKFALAIERGEIKSDITKVNKNAKRPA
jgi:hypothetical protein